MKIRNVFLFIVLSATGLLLAACGGDAAQTGPTEISVSVKDEFSFDPDTITVKAGEEVVITLDNTGSVEHTFNILKAGVDLEHALEEVSDEEELHEELILDIHETAAGESNSESFVAPSESGDYTIICVVPGHIQAGMTGTLKVTQ